MTAQVACNFVYLFRKNLIYFEEAIFNKLANRERALYNAFNQSLLPTGSAIIVNQSDLGNS